MELLGGALEVFVGVLGVFGRALRAQGEADKAMVKWAMVKRHVGR